MITIQRNDLLGNVLLLICEQDKTAKISNLGSLLLNPQCDRVERFLTKELAQAYCVANTLELLEEEETTDA